MKIGGNALGRRQGPVQARRAEAVEFLLLLLLFQTLADGFFQAGDLGIDLLLLQLQLVKPVVLGF